MLNVWLAEAKKMQNNAMLVELLEVLLFLRVLFPTYCGASLHMHLSFSLLCPLPLLPLNVYVGSAEASCWN